MSNTIKRQKKTQNIFLWTASVIFDEKDILCTTRLFNDEWITFFFFSNHSSWVTFCIETFQKRGNTMFIETNYSVQMFPLSFFSLNPLKTTLQLHSQNMATFKKKKTQQKHAKSYFSATNAVLLVSLHTLHTTNICNMKEERKKVGRKEGFTVRFYKILILRQ